MKFVKLLLLFSCVILAVMSRRNKRRSRWGANGTGAANTCKDFKITGNRLFASCTNLKGSQVNTGIDMSKCLENVNGELKVGGGYQLTCQLAVNGKNLSGSCKNKNGTPTNALLAINDAFGNMDGVLVC